MPALLKPEQPIYVKLPRAPINASPVPHLTSLYSSPVAGNYGSRAYPGNCGGNLIKDLIRFYDPKSVFDPMTGSGTCRDVCREIGVYCWSSDLHEGADACDASVSAGLLRVRLDSSAVLAAEALHDGFEVPVAYADAGGVP